MTIEINNSMSLNEVIANMLPGDTLILNDGIYNEKVEIWTNNIHIKAKNKHKAIINNKDYYHKIMSNHNECNTFNTFSLFVGAENVTLEGLVIENKATPSSVYGQAVALHVDGDNFNCIDCIIKSAQDTLFTGPMPADLLIRYSGFYEPKRLKGHPSKQIYNKCTIIGDVDFIFGCATALFNECEIISLDRNSNKPAYICAPAHSKETEYGYLFYKCHLMGSDPTYLGRPWRDFGKAAFIDCEMGSHILPEGYNKWDGTNRDKTAHFYEYTKGIDTSARVFWSKQLNENEAQKYFQNFIKFIQGDLK